MRAEGDSFENPGFEFTNGKNYNEGSMVLQIDPKSYLQTIAIPRRESWHHHQPHLKVRPEKAKNG
jgi:hypothetical protein